MISSILWLLESVRCSTTVIGISQPGHVTTGRLEGMVTPLAVLEWPGSLFAKPDPRSIRTRSPAAACVRHYSNRTDSNSGIPAEIETLVVRAVRNHLNAKGQRSPPASPTNVTKPPGQLGAAYFIPTVIVPLLLISTGWSFGCC
jgi:hypothetical protein